MDTMKPHVEMPELTIYGLHYCDLCGEPLIPGETHCGKCRAGRAIPPPVHVRPKSHGGRTDGRTRGAA